MNPIFSIAIGVGIAGVLTLGIFIGEGKQEAVECYSWQDQAKKYPGYYLTEWQKKQCDYHSIQIDAPIKK